MPSNFKDRTVALSGVTVQQVCERNVNRSFLLLFNAGPNDALVGFGNANLVTIPAGDGINFASVAPINAMTARCATAETASLVVWEA